MALLVIVATFPIVKATTEFVFHATLKHAFVAVAASLARWKHTNAIWFTRFVHALENARVVVTVAVVTPIAAVGCAIT